MSLINDARKINKYAQTISISLMLHLLLVFIITARKHSLREGYVFTGVCDSVNGGGRAWFYPGGVCVVLSGGACVVLSGGGMRGFIGGRAWFYSGGRAWFYLGGMHSFIRGACVVLSGGRAWFYPGGVRGFIRGGMRSFIRGACVVLSVGGVRGFSSFFGYNEIRSMSGRYASYWNAFLLWIYFRCYSDIYFVSLHCFENFI